MYRTFLLLLFTNLCFCQVGINTTTPDSSSILDINSNTEGILIPRMSELEKNNIVNPAESLMIYQTDATPGFYFYKDTEWVLIQDGSVKKNKYLLRLEYQNRSLVQTIDSDTNRFIEVDDYVINGAEITTITNSPTSLITVSFSEEKSPPKSIQVIAFLPTTYSYVVHDYPTEGLIEFNTSNFSIDNDTDQINYLFGNFNTNVLDIKIDVTASSIIRVGDDLNFPIIVRAHAYLIFEF